MGVLLTRDLIEHIEGGCSIAVASRDAELRPDCMRGFGATVSPDGAVITLYLYAPLARRMRANLEQNGCIAATFNRIVDHYTVQVKGRVRAIREATPADEETSSRYLVAFAEQVSLVGLPRSVVRRVRSRPAIAVEVEPLEAFLQTPGAGAGRKMDGTR